MKTHLVLVPVPGSTAARLIDPGSGIVTDASPFPRAGNVLVYYEGNRHGAVNMHKFEERVQCASGRLATKYPTIAFGSFPVRDFHVVGAYTFSEDFKAHTLAIFDASKTKVASWLALTPAIFKQKVPCADCPFRREGGVRHSPEMMASYASHFLNEPGATFPCHKSVPKDDPRDQWSSWRDGQVLCSGGLLFAAKHGAKNGIVRVGMANGWYDPAQHGAAELALVFDSVEEMLGAVVK